MINLDFFIYGFRGYMFIVTLITIFIIIVLLFALAFSAFGTEIKVDNTKKRVLTATIIIMDCYHNNTGCEIKAVETNRTDIGNLSRPMHYGKDYSKT